MDQVNIKCVVAGQECDVIARRLKAPGNTGQEEYMLTRNNVFVGYIYKEPGARFKGREGTELDQADIDAIAMQIERASG